MTSGSLVCVGTGMRLAGHISELGKSYIARADVVYCLMPDTLQEQWLESLNGNVRSLQPFYAEGKSRATTYDEMVETVVAAARDGQRVCLAMYGHPGVFAVVGHWAIARSRDLGISAEMIPGISAEDCLYADLGMDPGTTGMQQYEASQFMFYEHSVNPSALLVLWQISIAGEHTLTRFETDRERVVLLVDYLQTWYPAAHEIILYEAVFLPIENPRIERLSLRSLPDARLSTKTTLVVPPCTKPILNGPMLQKMGLSASDFSQS